MKIGVFPPFGDDLERNVAFARDVGANVAALRVAPDVSVDRLRAIKGRYAIEGVDASVVMAPRITTEAMIDERLRDQEIETLCGLIASMGEAGLEMLHLYVSSVRAPSELQEREAFWARLTDYYRRITARAEQAEIVLATHSHHSPSRLVWNYETFSRLLDAVPSPNNGAMLCTGKVHYAGDDLEPTIRQLGDRIVLVHIRNVAGDYLAGSHGLEEDKALEARFDAGDISIPSAFHTLKEIGFRGPVFAEHYPPIAGDPVAATAWTVGYFKGVEAFLNM